MCVYKGCINTHYKMNNENSDTHSSTFVTNTREAFARVRQMHTYNNKKNYEGIVY